MKKLTSRIRFSKNSIFLADFLAKNALNWLMKKSSSLRENDIKEIFQTCFFLASKINERDINIPTLPDIVIAGGKIYH